MNIVDMVDSQLIASILNEKDIEKAINSHSNIVFLLTGNLLNIESHVTKLHKANKQVFIHLDFIDGIANSKAAIQYIAKVCNPAGIITTKGSLIKLANNEGLITIQRLFLIDSGAIAKGLEMIKSCKPNAVEVLPGIMPTLVDQLTRQIKIPLIAGGLISTKDDILKALKAGALAVSSGNPSLWNIDLES